MATKPPVLPVWAESGDKIQPTDADLISGWPQTNTPPSRQRFNWILNFLMNGVRYLTNRGIPDWDAGETYAVACVVIGPDNKTYKAKLPSLGKIPAANPGEWIRWGFDSDEIATLTAGAALPAGAVSAFARNTAPSGWLVCNGQVVSRSTYAALFTAIGTTFGAGDGSTTFQVPDLRGEFVRGWDAGRGVDGGRGFGSFQGDELKSHSHSFSLPVDADSSSGNDDESISTMGGSQGFNTNSTGGSETRPRNVALLYCIKT